jgi:hypothetical protein
MLARIDAIGADIADIEERIEAEIEVRQGLLPAQGRVCRGTV